MARKNALTSAIAVSAIALGAAACSGTATAAAKGASSSPARSGGTTSANSSSSLTVTQARQAFNGYVSQDDSALKRGNKAAALAVARGVEWHQVSDAFLAPHPRPYSYAKPSFIVPAGQSSYPQWFAVAAQSTAPAGAPSSLAGVPEPARGRTLLTFEKKTAREPWQLSTSMQLQPGQQVPALASASGQTQVAPLDDTTSYLVRPDMVGPLQAAVVDDGPAASARSAVTDGPLTTGLYSTEHAIKPPKGDVRQWYMEGGSDNRYAVRTANGGALVFYSQDLKSVTEIPALLALSKTIHPGKTISVPSDFAALLPSHEAHPRVKLETDYELAFVAIDPPASAKNAKIQVIGIGGAPSSATGSSSGK